MNAILILIAMFSLTLVFSNLGFLNKAKVFSFLSIPLIVGIILSPDGIIPLLPSTRDNLGWAVRVALTWMTFLVGAKFYHQKISFQHIRRFVPVCLSYVLFFMLSLLLLSILQVLPQNISWTLESYPIAAIALSILLSSALFSSEENPILLILTIFSFFFIFAEFTALNLAFSLGIGLILSLVSHLILEKNNTDSTRLILGAICILATGWSISSGGLEVIVGLTWGYTLTMFRERGVSQDEQLQATSTSTLFTLALFSGLYTSLNQHVLIAGASLAVIRLFIKYLLINSRLKKTEDFKAFSRLLPIAKLALPVTLCLHLSYLKGPITLFIISTFVVGFLVNDLLILGIEIYKGQLLLKKVRSSHE